MHWAAQNGHEVVVATLLAAGATSKAEDQVDTFTPPFKGTP